MIGFLLCDTEPLPECSHFRREAGRMGEGLRHGLELRVLGLGLRPAVCVLPECLVSATLGLGRRRRPEERGSAIEVNCVPYLPVKKSVGNL